ncbi:hypothetical protein OM076_35940 [Solirubrobacter ginsenosidimutans]|uniref:Exo-alpha-sialidase n=1 Tax=Solirubrobacter ginsenosidimutans TaxID=490573 RepID=A0A9X3MZM7_9ACTN|nr:hypothetical protein [Solirubrobacter ginsenosidimutans]MDA0165715.1 hypothetical protein [Solirubrobacter ginsenosidimutans]
MRRFLLPASILVVAGAAAALAGVGSGGTTSEAQATRLAALTPIQQRLVSGFARAALEQSAGLAPNARTQQPTASLQRSSLTGCPTNRGSNVRVNQNCLNLTDPDLQGRGQAQNETAIAQDSGDPRRMVSSANDYRRGDANCYSDYSVDGGRSWQDSTPPMGFTRGDNFGGVAREYWQAAGDTSVAWDTKGNAYLSCQMFMRGEAVANNPDQSSAFYVFRSTGSGGASWNFPARPVAELNDVAGAGDALLDKQYMTVDDQRGSPFQDRIYVTWTLFAPDGTSYIYEAYSRDYAESFSAPKLVSTTSALCSNTLGGATPQGTCNTNQFSQPFTGPDGALYVVWDNYNLTGVRPGEGDEGGDGGDRRAAPPVGIDNRAQVLLAKSTDGGNTFAPPVKVADYYDLPDCETYQGKDPGVACVPEKGETANSYFRAVNYPSAGVNPRDPREIDVTFGSYINRHSNERQRTPCVPQGYNPDTFQALYSGVKTPGACNNDILISRSTNGGRSFTGGSTDVRTLPDAREGDERADQFWQWAAFDTRGRLAVSFYDRAYGNDEQTGFSDVSLSGTRDGSTFGTTRVTTSSMAPPTQFEGAFFGDYSGLSADDVAHPAWMDTRDPDLFVCRDSAGNVTQPPGVCTASAPNAAQANDQNIYTEGINIPVK